MNTLTVNQNQVDYVGVLEKPAFSLMREARQVIEGLYNCFSTYQVALSDFRAEETVTNPSTWGVNVYLKSLGVYRFKFDRLEWTASDFADDDLRHFSEILKRGEEWLRAVVPGVSFKSHTFLYTAHCKLSEGTSQDFLLGIQQRELIEMGRSLGAGVIHNWVDPEKGGRYQLMIDHSLPVKDGLFIQFLVLIEVDEISHSSVVEKGQEILKDVLKQIGLQFEAEQEA